MRYRSAAVAALIAACLLAACQAVPPPPPPPAPAEAAPSFIQVGLASWYGPGFHGHRTADGERFDTNGLTAAHRTLPLNTVVRVTNLENGRTVMVRINDRGPYIRGRVIDLSPKAARALGMKDDGVAKVRIERLAQSEAAL